MPANINTVSIKMFVRKAQDWLRYLFKKRMSIIISAIAGGLLGLAFAFLSKPTYTGDLTFVLSTQSDPTGGLLDLASEFGLSFGDKNNAFNGENIIELFRSKKMFRQALFEKIPENNQLIINQICREENFFNQWQKNGRLKPLIPFKIADTSSNSGIKDSLITAVYKYAITHYYTLNRIDKNLNFYKVSVTTTDEYISNYLPKALVNVTADFYIQLKSVIANRNLQMLENEADSIRNVLEKSQHTTLQQKENILNLNSTFQSAETPVKISEAQTSALQETYKMVVQNMAIAKITLQKITPVYNVIDEPRLGLNKFKLSLPAAFAVSALFTAFFSVFFLLVKKSVQENN